MNNKLFSNKYEPLLGIYMSQLLLLAVADYRSSFGSGAVILDDCNFHESVRLDNFDLDRTLTLVSELKQCKQNIC